MTNYRGNKAEGLDKDYTILQDLTYLNNASMIYTWDTLIATNEIISLYFGASWCSVDLEFRSQLLSHYKSIHTRYKSNDRNIGEVIYVSSDADRHDWDVVRTSSPWLSATFGNSATQIKHLYGVWADPEVGPPGVTKTSEIPVIVILDKLRKPLAYFRGHTRFQSPKKSLDNWMKAVVTLAEASM